MGEMVTKLYTNCNIRHYYETHGNQTKKEKDGQTFVRVHDIGCDGTFILENGHLIGF